MNTYEKDELVRELRDRSEDIGGHPIAFEQVKLSARRIQRRRRIASGAVAAMALAVAVPTALSVTSALNSAPQPIDTPNPTPSVTETAAPRPDGPVVLATRDLPQGEPAEVPYIQYDGTAELVTPEATIALPAPYQMITPFQDGWLAIEERGGTKVVQLDADMNVVDTRPSGGPSFALHPDGKQVAWTERDGDAVTLFSAPTEGFDAMTWEFESQADVVPLGFLPGYEVVFTTYGEPTINAIADVEGNVTPLDGFIALRDASAASGLVSGLTTSELMKTCFGVMDPAASTEKLLWERCDYSAEAFSPNGQYVIGGTPEADGPGSPNLAILDAQTGDVVLEFKPEKDHFVAIMNAAWEDDDSIVAIMFDENDVVMLRFGLDGSIEQIGERHSSMNMDVPYWFADVRR